MNLMELDRRWEWGRRQVRRMENGRGRGWQKRGGERKHMIFASSDVDHLNNKIEQFRWFGFIISDYYVRTLYDMMRY